MNRFQLVLNSAARAVAKTHKFHHTRSILKSLHWLKINERIKYKALSLTYIFLRTGQPSYLRSLLSFPSHHSIQPLIVKSTVYKYAYLLTYLLKVHIHKENNITRNWMGTATRQVTRCTTWCTTEFLLLSWQEPEKELIISFLVGEVSETSRRLRNDLLINCMNGKENTCWQHNGSILGRLLLHSGERMSQGL